MSKSLTLDDFVERGRKKHGTKYGYYLVNYIDYTTPVEIVCPYNNHGSFWTTPKNHLHTYGRGCPKCGSERSGLAATFRNQYIYNYDILEQENDITSYLLGAFITDGSIHTAKNRPSMRSISLDSQDYSWLEQIKNIVCPELSIKKDRTCYRLYFNQIRFVDWFIERGIVPNKSLTAQLPLVPKQYLPDLIRGCIDGDGCIGNYKSKYITKNGISYYYKPQCYICSASEGFIQQIAHEIGNYGLKYFTDVVKQKHSVIDGRTINSSSFLYKIRFSSKNANDFLQWVYYPEHKISMPRKLEIVKEIRSLYDRKN